MRTTTTTAAAAAIMLAATLLTGCSSVDDTGPTDATKFCAYLGSRMMEMADQTHTPDPARVAESDQKMQEVADQIAATEDGYHGLGNLTRSFIAAGNPTDAAGLAGGLQVYCRAHGLA